MNPTLKLQRRALTGYLEEVKVLEEHELAWSQVLYQYTFNPSRDRSRNHNGIPPAFVTQDNPAARFAVYTARHNAVSIYVKIQELFLEIKANEPWSGLVNQYKPLLTNACLLKLRVLEEEHRAYLDDQQAAEMAKMADKETVNVEAMVWIEHLIKLYHAVYHDLLDYQVIDPNEYFNPAKLEAVNIDPMEHFVLGSMYETHKASAMHLWLQEFSQWELFIETQENVFNDKGEQVTTRKFNAFCLEQERQQLWETRAQLFNANMGILRCLEVVGRIHSVEFTEELRESLLWDFASQRKKMAWEMSFYIDPVLTAANVTQDDARVMRDNANKNQDLMIKYSEAERDLKAITFTGEVRDGESIFT
ncbi:hypothetical protein BGW39_001595 [Mortierella sp. 14UC]|nr:hypothetical protein BGW39_001595 [Mortierella sp. 14UC]